MGRDRDKVRYRGRTRAGIAMGTGTGGNPGSRAGQAQVSASRVGPLPPPPALSTARTRGTGGTVPEGACGGGVGDAGTGATRGHPSGEPQRPRVSRASGDSLIVLQELLREFRTGPLGAS